MLGTVMIHSFIIVTVFEQPPFLLRNEIFNSLRKLLQKRWFLQFLFTLDGNVGRPNNKCSPDTKT